MSLKASKDLAAPSEPPIRAVYEPPNGPVGSAADGSSKEGELMAGQSLAEGRGRRALKAPDWLALQVMPVRSPLPKPACPQQTPLAEVERFRLHSCSVEGRTRASPAESSG